MADVNLNPSLAEYISQAQRGMYSRVFGPDFLMKQTYFTVDTATGIFNTTYGRKVWHALNNQVRFFNLIPKVVWGNTAGWRIRSDRGTGRSRPVTETGTLPTVNISTIQTVSSLPRIVSSTFGSSVKAIFTANLEGGVGDVLAMEQENTQIDHIKELNFELLAAPGFRTSAGAATTFTVPASVAFHFKVGDAVAQYDGVAFQRTTGSTVSAVNNTTGVVTVATGTAFANANVAFIFSRAGFTSIADIVESDVAAGATTGIGGLANEVVAHSLSIGARTAGGWNAAASVQRNSGVGRDLTLNLIDNAIRDIRKAGGEPKVMVMGHDQYFRLQRLLNTNQRYFGQEEYQVGVGNEKTFPGTRAGFVVATYQGIPVIPDNDCPASVDTGNNVIGQDLFVLDTDYLEIAIAQPTQYVENRDYFAANSLVVRGLLYTLGELRCTGFNRQSKIVDLNV